jgi:acyl carrier protein
VVVVWTQDAVLESVRRELSRRLGLEQEAVAADRDLVDELGMTSLDGMELAIFIEDTFGTVVRDGDMPQLRTPSALADYVIADLAQRGAAP